MISTKVSPREQELIALLHRVKAEAGSHPPNQRTLEDRVPEIKIKIDACFLSNPYATDLFVDRLTTDLVETGKLRDFLEFYPSQNNHLAYQLEKVIGVPQDQIFVCNGAIEAIQAAMHRIAGAKVVVVLPTFSPYYEYLRPDQEVVYYHLRRENDFELVADDFIEFVLQSGADTVCLINPNNPNGGYVPAKDMRRILEAFSGLGLVVLDESFIDFAYEDEQLSRSSMVIDAARMPHVMLIKSMSKDFGIAGLRAGYAVMSPERLRLLLRNGYLWNIGGLAEFFFRLFAEDEFQRLYSAARLRYLDEAFSFFRGLRTVPCLKTYDTKANFCLAELDPAVPLTQLVPLLLIRHGVYVRDCTDKVGLEDGQYLRIAGRKGPQNETLLLALRDVVDTLT